MFRVDVPALIASQYFMNHHSWNLMYCVWHQICFGYQKEWIGTILDPNEGSYTHDVVHQRSLILL
jgi:hypothetical protein